MDVAHPGGGLPTRVSPSQVASFGSCQLRYYFATVLGWREPASPASTQGVLVHATLEHLYLLPPDQRTRDRAGQLLRERAQVLFADPGYEPFRADQQLATQAFAAVGNLFTLEDPAGLDVEQDGLESPVQAVLDGVSFGGRLDRRTGGAVPRITDYKSGAKPAPAYLADKLTQLYLYAAAELESGGQVAEVELLYLGGQGARVRRPVFPAVIRDARKSLVTMASTSQAALADLTFQARRSPLCQYCSFRRACPQFAVSAPTPGSGESDQILTGIGLVRRSRPEPEPLEPLVDSEQDLGW